MSQRKRKREVRDDEDEDFEENQDESESDEESDDKEPPKKKRKEDPRLALSQRQPTQNTQGSQIVEEAPTWSKGKIVRIRLHNFMTYDDVEIFPDPGLNLILGANGTGKSSIVCGFCLGLGGNHKLLGRSNDASAFIKHQTKEGFIEIELYKEEDENMVVRRGFKFGSKISNWRLNGKKVAKKIITAKMEKMNIQFENLTQFLPQDKVGLFAGLSPEDLLKWTQKSILGKDELEAYNKLLEMQEGTGDEVRTIDELERNLKIEEDKNEVLKKQVDQYIQKKKHLEIVKKLQVKIHIVRFTDCAAGANTLKKEHNHAKLEYNKYDSNETPLRKKIQELETRLDENRRKCRNLKIKHKEASRSTNITENKLNKIGQVFQDYQNEVNQLYNRFQRKREEEEELKTKIVTCERQLGNMGDKNELKEKVLELRKEHKSRESEYEEIQGRRERLDEQKETKRDDLRSFEGQLNRLKDLTSLKKRKVQREYRDSYRCYEWVERKKRERGYFEGEVYFVPMVVEIPHEYRDYIGILEWQVANHYWKAFVVTNHNDRQKILKDYADKNRARITVIQAREEQYQRRYDLEQLKREYNVVTDLESLYTTDYPIVRSVLQNGGTNNVVICRNETQIDRLLKETPIKAAFDLEGGRRYVFSRSEYRNRKESVQQGKFRTRGFQAGGKVLVSIDRDKLVELERKKRDLLNEVRDIEIEVEELEKKEGAALTARNACGKDIKIVRSKVKKMNIYATRLKQFKKELEEKAEEDIAGEEKRILLKMHKENMKRVDTAAKVRDLIRQQIKITDKLLLTQLSSFKDNETHQKLLDQQNLERSEKTRLKLAVDNLQRKYKECKDNLVILKERAIRERDKFLNEYNEMSRRRQDRDEINGDKLREMLMELPEDIATLQEICEKEKVAADRLIGDEEALREFEERNRQILVMKERLTGLQDDYARVRERIKETEKLWSVPYLRKMASINNAFQRFCASVGICGEVSLKIDDRDYKQSIVDLKVKFRDEEKLTRLTSGRQSGGEKSVTTILYILAMQSEGKSPFFIVDEINQGMDPNNEKRVFLEMVRHSNRKGTPQSFLITPKLLPDLIPIDAKYLKIFFIFNGAFNLGMKKTKGFMKKWFDN